MPLKRHIEKFVDSNLWDSFWKGLKHHNSSEDDSTQDINTLNTFTSALPNQIVLECQWWVTINTVRVNSKIFIDHQLWFFFDVEKSISNQSAMHSSLSHTNSFTAATSKFENHKNVRKKPFAFVIYDSLLSSPSLASVISSGSVPPFLI